MSLIPLLDEPEMFNNFITSHTKFYDGSDDTNPLGTKIVITKNHFILCRVVLSFSSLLLDYESKYKLFLIVEACFHYKH